MNAMKRKAEENLTPSTPDPQKSWLKTRSTSRQIPNSPPDGPPSPSPRPRTSQKKTKKNLGMNPSWTQLGGIAQAGRQSVDDGDYSGLWLDSLNGNWSNRNGNSNVNFDVPALGKSNILATGPNDDTGAVDDMFAFDTLLQGTPGRLNIDETLGVPMPMSTKISSAQKRSTPIDKSPFSQDVENHSRSIYYSDSFNHSDAVPVQASKLTSDFIDPTNLPTTHSTSYQLTNPSSISTLTNQSNNTLTNPTIIKPSLLRPSNSRPLPLPLHPPTNLTRPLQLNDEVHLLDHTNSDLSGQITYRITHVGNHGVYTIVPVPSSLRCGVERLIRAPLGEGDIVSVFVGAANEASRTSSASRHESVLRDGQGKQMEMKQADWGAITRRWVENGERRYDVVSWDERFAGRVWEGLVDGQIGMYDLERDTVG